MIFELINAMLTVIFELINANMPLEDMQIEIFQDGNFKKIKFWSVWMVLGLWGWFTWICPGTSSDGLTSYGNCADWLSIH